MARAPKPRPRLSPNVVMPRSSLVVVWCVWLSLASSLPARAQPLDGQMSALLDLGPLRVEVQLIGAAEQAGLDHALIIDAVEKHLRQSSVAIRDREDRSERGDPTLRVAAQVINAAGGYAFLVSVQLVERVVNYRRYVTLVLDGALPTTPTASVEPLEIAPAVKWEAQALGTTSRANARSSIPRAILDYVSRFVEDYAAVNR